MLGEKNCHNHQSFYERAVRVCNGPKFQVQGQANLVIEKKKERCRRTPPLTQNRSSNLSLKIRHHKLVPHSRDTSRKYSFWETLEHL